MVKCGEGDIFGVTKLDVNKRILSSNIVVGSMYHFNHMDAESREFIENVYFSDEWMNHANKNNEGFLGSVQKGQDGFSILCNGIWDSDLVTALRWADCNEGVAHVQGTKREKKTWKELKADLNERQLACVNAMLQENQKSENRQDTMGIVAGGESR